MKPTRPEDLFRAEKERARSSSTSQHARLLAEAKAAFDKLMAEGQAARKSGRPRKHPLPPLKTTSSRTPPRPPAPAPVVNASVPAPSPTPKPAPQPVVPVKAAKAIQTSTPRRVVKKAAAAKPAKPKRKAAKSKKR